jgi:hypothetical protein
MKKVLISFLIATFLISGMIVLHSCGGKEPPQSTGAKTPASLTLGNVPYSVGGCPFDPVNTNYTIVFSIITYQGGTRVNYDPAKFPDVTIKHKAGQPGGEHSINLPSNGTWGVIVRVSISGTEGMMDCHSCCAFACNNPATGQRQFSRIYEPGAEELKSSSGGVISILEAKFTKVECNCCF